MNVYTDNRWRGNEEDEIRQGKKWKSKVIE
jgi:hypothetical protein